jgi:hypothetical protein
MESTMHEIARSKARITMTTELCQNCGFHPASPRIAGYCSWDCHDADDGDDEEGDEGEGGGEEAA